MTALEVAALEALIRALHGAALLSAVAIVVLYARTLLLALRSPRQGANLLILGIMCSWAGMLLVYGQINVSYWVQGVAGIHAAHPLTRVAYLAMLLTGGACLIAARWRAAGLAWLVWSVGVAVLTLVLVVAEAPASRPTGAGTPPHPAKPLPDQSGSMPH